jgi:hypothetical protein
MENAFEQDFDNVYEGNQVNPIEDDLRGSELQDIA